MNEAWKNDPRLAHIEKAKLELLQQLAAQGNHKGIHEMLPFLMGAAAQGREGGLTFTSEEISSIIDVLKTESSPDEAYRLNQIINLMRLIR